jgi:hypothetical protein
MLLPCDYSLSLKIQTPYQHFQTTLQWLAPFTLTTSSPTSDGVISFDTLCDAETAISTTVNESVAQMVRQILGPSWQMVDLCEFEKKGKRIILERRKGNQGMKLVVVDGSNEIECVNTSLEYVLLNV